MKHGYIAHYHSRDEPWGRGLPFLLAPDETLDEGLERIKEAIRKWILDAPKDKGGPLRHLTISLMGPLMADESYVHRTPEEALAEAKTPEERFDALGDAAKSRFEAGEFELAREYALELQKLTPSYRKSPNYGNAIADFNIVLGRLALREGNVEEAERLLLEAGKSPGSPQMHSFGPNMSLAQDLLVAGRTQAVFDYFECCREIWSEKFSQLDEWSVDVNEGRIPDFGANLKYLRERRTLCLCPNP